MRGTIVPHGPGDVAARQSDVARGTRVHSGAVVVDLASWRRQHGQAEADPLVAELLGFTVRPGCTGVCTCWGAPLGGGRP